MCHDGTAIMILPFKCPPLKRILQIVFKQIIDIRFQSSMEYFSSTQRIGDKINSIRKKKITKTVNTM